MSPAAASAAAVTLAPSLATISGHQCKSGSVGVTSSSNNISDHLDGNIATTSSYNSTQR